MERAPNGETAEPPWPLWVVDHLNSILKNVAAYLPQAPVWSHDPHWDELSTFLLQPAQGRLCSHVFQSGIMEGIETSV